MIETWLIFPLTAVAEEWHSNHAAQRLYMAQPPESGWSRLPGRESWQPLTPYSLMFREAFCTR